MIFLAGLNLDYDPIRIQILERDPFPTLRQAYSYMQREECQRSTMLYIPSQVRSAVITTPQMISKQRREDRLGDVEKPKRKCNHCGN